MYVSELLENKSMQLSPDDLGVVTLYRAQARVIAAALRLLSSPTRQLSKVTVSVVDEFLGVERKVIVVSTVITGVTTAMEDTQLVAKSDGSTKCNRCQRSLLAKRSSSSTGSVGGVDMEKVKLRIAEDEDVISRMLCAAITRHTALCVVVGDPFSLRNWEEWEEFIEICSGSNMAAGVRLRPRQESMQTE